MYVKALVNVVVAFEAAVKVPPERVNDPLKVVLADALKVPDGNATVPVKAYTDGPAGVNTSPGSNTTDPEVNVNEVGTKFKSVALSGFRVWVPKKFAVSMRFPDPVSYQSLRLSTFPAVLVII